MDADLVKSVIDKKEDFLRRHLVLSVSVIQKLRQVDVIGEFTMMQMVANRNTRDRQMTLLLNSIKSRGLPAFQGFLNVLRETYHSWIADDIMETNIDSNKNAVLSRSTISVRDVINRSYQHDLYEGQMPYPQGPPGYLYPTIPYYPIHGGHVMYQIPDAGGPQFAYGRGKLHQRSKYPTRASEGHRNYETKSANSPSGRNSPITQVPENLRDLQKTFDTESSSTHNSIAMLKQEELTIKALLQQNLREQHDLLLKQEALVDIKEKMKYINKTATQLYKPQPDSNQTRIRLKYLHRVPWSQKD